MSTGGPATDLDRGRRRRAPTWLREVTGAALAWIATRSLVLLLFFGPERQVTGSLAYIARSLADRAAAGLDHTLVEYPVPAVGLMAAPWYAVRLLHMPQAYPEALLVLCLLVDAAFAACLTALTGESRKASLWVWVLAVPLLGATAYARFDIVPAALAGVALLLLRTRPRAAAAVAALATGLKLWPALVLPAAAAPSRTRRAVVLDLAVLGALFVATGLALGGWGRMVSPLAYQARRGLQIESVAATPAMVAWAVRPGVYDVTMSRFHAVEVSGPWTQGLLRASTLLTLAVLVWLVALWRRALRHGTRITAETVTWLAFAGVTASMVTSRVLSPQYLIWLLPLAAAARALSGSRALAAWVAVLLVSTALTQLVYPLGYAHLHSHDGLTAWTVLALVVRNGLLVALAVAAAAQAVRAVRRAEAAEDAEDDLTIAPAP